MADLTAILYPRCMVKKKVGLLLAPFFEEIALLIPSRSDMSKVKWNYPEIPLKIKKILSLPVGYDPDEFSKGIEAMKRWGEQMGLGEQVTFETFYSALTSSQDDEIKNVIKAIKGKDEKDILTASRAFLSLSLETDIKEDELESEMESIDERTRRLSELVEEASELGQKREQETFIEPLSKPRERLRAWIRLALKAKDVFDFWPVGESIEIKDILDASYEKITRGKFSKDITDFRLPEKDRLKDEDLIYRVRGLFSKLLDKLKDYRECDEKNPDKKLIHELSDEIKSILVGSDIDSGPRLILTYYEGVSWSNLIVNALLKESPLDKEIKGGCISLFLV